MLQIKALVTDFDGVHTDNTVLVDEEGREFVSCSRRDGMGIELLREKGLHLLILSREANPVVRARARKLRMEVMHHVLDKLPALDDWRREAQLQWEEIAYIGDDINDIDCLKACGLGAVPADAHKDAKVYADLVLTENGGKGAIRELCDYLLANDLVLTL